MVWFSLDEHTFSHSWDKVVEAALRKYPNPETNNVYGTDIYDRKIDEDGKLHSRRIISSVWSNSYMDWMSRLTGLDLSKIVHAIEYSILDPQRKSFQLTSRNYNFLNYIVIDEKLTYTPSPVDPSSTLLKQEWHITCKNLSFNQFFESAMGTTMKKNAVKGRLGVEHVIGQVKEEVEKFASYAAVEEMQNFASTTLKEFSSFQHSIEAFGKKVEENLQADLKDFINKSTQS